MRKFAKAATIDRRWWITPPRPKPRPSPEETGASLHSQLNRNDDPLEITFAEYSKSSSLAINLVGSCSDMSRFSFNAACTSSNGIPRIRNAMSFARRFHALSATETPISPSAAHGVPSLRTPTDTQPSAQPNRNGQEAQAR